MYATMVTFCYYYNLLCYNSIRLGNLSMVNERLRRRAFGDRNEQDRSAVPPRREATAIAKLPSSRAGRSLWTPRGCRQEPPAHCSCREAPRRHGVADTNELSRRRYFQRLTVNARRPPTPAERTMSRSPQTSERGNFVGCLTHEPAERTVASARARDRWLREGAATEADFDEARDVARVNDGPRRSLASRRSRFAGS